jgi:hypothetical protein
VNHPLTYYRIRKKREKGRPKEDEGEKGREKEGRGENPKDEGKPPVTQSSP